MSEVKAEAPSTDLEKPVEPSDGDIIKFPPFPDPTDADFDEDILEEERNFYSLKYPDVNAVKTERLHCTACDRHLGCSARNESKIRCHPMLRTLMCHSCHTFYNSGEFEKGDDGSELYCRWCGQGGQVYCCADCPHVFCAKCIKRNFGMPKIREIEATDDWKCFKCNPRCLWDLRAVCWALLRFCDLRNKITEMTQDEKLKEAYKSACALDDTVCCRNKMNRRKEKEQERKKKEAEVAKKNTAANAVTNAVKMSPSIQVKKFASINIDDSPKEKKAQKRSLSPKNKPILIRAPMQISNRLVNPAVVPVAKKVKVATSIPITPIRIQQKHIPNTYARIRPKPPQMPMAILNNLNTYNGYNNPPLLNNYLSNDNINLSLESLTQGLDMAAVATTSSGMNNDVVCTPDFPLEPLCEVREENNDDDVECITPGPTVAQMISNPPPLAPRFPFLNELSSENIIQMTENDVTVNAATGGLKFRVDPQTLSSNKMYRLPDGRIFAINANPNMPGGYSATIVALSDSSSSKNMHQGSTYAAKLNPVSVPKRVPQTPSPKPRKQNRHTPRILNSAVLKVSELPKSNQSAKANSSRHCDLNVPVEWYRYNLIDAADALEYSLTRLRKLRKEATSMFLRTRTVDEMRSLQKSLDRLLNTSATRIHEIRDNLKTELKQYINKKMNEGSAISDDDDDDDVEILNDHENDDPIFIDENSMESNANESNATHEVDLTGAASSEHNDSGDKSMDDFDKDPLENSTQNRKENSIDSHINESSLDITKENEESNLNLNGDNKSSHDNEENDNEEESVENKTQAAETDVDMKEDDNNESAKPEAETNELDDDDAKKQAESNKEDLVSETDQIMDGNADEATETVENIDINDDKGQDTELLELNEDKSQDTEMTEELIETLLNDDTSAGESVSQNINSINIPEVLNES